MMTRRAYKGYRWYSEVEDDGDARWTEHYAVPESGDMIWLNLSRWRRHVWSDFCKAVDAHIETGEGLKLPRPAFIPMTEVY